MDRPDYERIRARLSQAGDAELLKLVRICDAVFRSDVIQSVEQVDRPKRVSVDRHRCARFKCDFNFLGSVRSFLR